MLQQENEYKCSENINIFIVPKIVYGQVKSFNFLIIIILTTIELAQFNGSCFAMGIPVFNFDTKPLGNDIFSKTILECKPTILQFDRICAENIFLNDTTNLNRDEIIAIFLNHGGKCSEHSENNKILTCSIYVYLKRIKVSVLLPNKDAGFDAFDILYTIQFDKKFIDHVNITTINRSNSTTTKGQETKIGEEHGKQ